MTDSTSASSTPEISVVVVNWNGGDELLHCLKSLGSNPPSVDWEAIVVDNASSDGSPDRLQAEVPWVSVIANERNRGLAAANNQGVVASRAPFVLISNPDVVYRHDTIDALYRTLQRRPRAAVAVPQILQSDGERQTSAGSLPTLAEALRGAASSGRRDSPTEGFWWHRWPHDEERRIGHGAEACYLVRREAVVEAGLQDEHFPLDWEGIEWAARFQDAGWELWFTPTSVVEHAGGVAIRQVPYRWILQSHVGMYRYFRRRKSAVAAPVIASLIAARCAAKLAVQAMHQNNLNDRARGHWRLDARHR